MKVKGEPGKFTIVDGEGKIIDAVGSRRFNSVKEAQDFATKNSIEGVKYKKGVEVDPIAATRSAAPAPLTGEQLARQRFMEHAKLGGEVDSVKNLHLYENRNLTVQEYIGKYRKGGISEVLPAEAAQMKVEDALRQGLIGDTNVRKLLIDTRDKFVK